MKDYFKPAKIITNDLYFYHIGIKYQGKGIITWDPDKGFHLEALLEQPIRHPDRIELGRVRVSDQSDYSSIRAWTSDYGWMLIPKINISSLQDDLIGGNLSLNFSYIFICESNIFGIDSSAWHGSALYHLKKTHKFPDRVTVDTQIAGEIIQRIANPGFFFEDETRKIIGYFLDKDHLYLTWKLPKQEFAKQQAWDWPIGFQDSLQIWLGETVHLLKREMRRVAQTVMEIRKCQPPKSFGQLSLIEVSKIPREEVLYLSYFFCRKLEHSDVCRKIFQQVAEAANQQLQTTQEFIVSTILEASLRTIYDYPISRADNSTGLLNKRLIPDFKRDYLSNAWRGDCKRIFESFKRLRDRNAHPDWLTHSGGAMSTEMRTEALDDMIYMCRFYGYMILALAGFRELEPNFPEPHSNWGPAVIITHVGNIGDSSIPPDFPNIPSPFEEMAQHEKRYKRMLIYRKFFMNRNMQANQMP
ncbi:hypothetical protein [Nodosilinea nodulosa]|uniref:hypothetical protein n=1 Tax=Nodosilinea nodulosa TaxID=416001 RepID=UPI000311305E|nr:hypothetical protein [Nodosilinea nodulosa]